MDLQYKTFTPKQVARALGVSESSLKRWCDQGRIATVRTAGGHRRATLPAVLEFLKAAKRPLVRPEILGLPVSSGQSTRSLERAETLLGKSLVSGDQDACRQVILDLFLAGHSISAICDDVLSPAFRKIGFGWSCGEVEVYQERRACEICARVLHELETLIPAPPATAPLAIGGTIAGDLYDLATTSVAMTLRQNGWRAISLGRNLPFSTMRAAIQAHRPKLFWISMSHIADEAAFVSEYGAFYEAVAPLTRVAVGGRALTEEIRGKMKYSVFCDRLGHLESYLPSLAGSP